MKLIEEKITKLPNRNKREVLKRSIKEAYSCYCKNDVLYSDEELAQIESMLFVINHLLSL